MSAARVETDRDVSDQIVDFKRQMAPRRAELKVPKLYRLLPLPQLSGLYR